MLSSKKKRPYRLAHLSHSVPISIKIYSNKKSAPSLGLPSTTASRPLLYVAGRAVVGGELFNVSIRQHTSAYVAEVDGELLKSSLLPPYFSYGPFHFTPAYLAVVGGELLKSSLLPPYFSYRPFHFLTRKVKADVCVRAFS
jgi:hypothetical protein